MTESVSLSACLPCLYGWLFEIAIAQSLPPEVIYVSVETIERVVLVLRSKLTTGNLQLVGIAVFWIVSKFYLTSPFAAEALVDFTADAYTSQELVAMELQILIALKFHVRQSTFLREIQQQSIDPLDSRVIKALVLRTLQTWSSEIVLDTLRGAHNACQEFLDATSLPHELEQLLEKCD